MSAKTKLLTPAGTVSYPHFATPQQDREDPNKPPKYSGTLVFAKGTDLKDLEAAAIQAATDFFGAQVKLPNGQSITVQQAMSEGIIRSPFRKDALAKGYPEGSIFINCRSNQKPGCVYRHAGPDGLKPAEIPAEKVKDELYAGSQARFSVAAFGYNNKGNKGVSFALNNVQKMGEGERIDGRVAAENEFDADLSATPASLDSLIGG